MTAPPARYTNFLQPPWKGLVLEAHADGLRQALAGEVSGATVAGGRGHVQMLEVDGEPFVHRRYLRGGAMRILGDRYFFNRARAEFLVTLAVREAGIPAPEPACVAWQRSGFFLRGVLITRWLEGEDLDVVLRRVNGSTYRAHEKPPPHPNPLPRGGRKPRWRSGGEGTEPSEISKETLGEVGAIFRRMHDAGIYHADLQVKNVRITPSGPVLLDFDNARIGTRGLSPLQRARNLLRFARSLEKNGLERHYLTSILGGYGPLQIPHWLQLSYKIKGRLSDMLSGRRTSA